MYYSLGNHSGYIYIYIYISLEKDHLFEETAHLSTDRIHIPKDDLFLAFYPCLLLVFLYVQEKKTKKMIDRDRAVADVKKIV